MIVLNCGESVVSAKEILRVLNILRHIGGEHRRVLPALYSRASDLHVFRLALNPNEIEPLDPRRALHAGPNR